MNNTTDAIKGCVLFVAVFLLIFSLSVCAESSDSDIDPDKIKLVSLNNKDTDQVNEIEISYRDPFSFELDGLDSFPRPLRVEIGGVLVSLIEEDDAEIRPRSDCDVSEGKQTLKIVLEDRDQRSVLAQTQVDVTEVNLDREEEDDSRDFDPDNVDISSVNGQDADRVNDIEVVWNKDIELDVDGIDNVDGFLHVQIDGVRIATISAENETFRPYQNRDVSKGQQTLKLIRKRHERFVVSQTEVNVINVDLSEDDVGELDFNPDNVEIASVNGQSPSRADLELKYNEPVSIQLDGLDVSEHGLLIKLDGKILTMLEEDESKSRPRKVDITEGSHELAVFKKAEAGREVLIAKTSVNVASVNLKRDSEPELNFDPDEVELASINENEVDGTTDLELTRDNVSLELEGLDVSDNRLLILLDGKTFGLLNEDDEFKPRLDNVSEGLYELTVNASRPRGGYVTVAKTKINLTVSDAVGRKRMEPEDVNMTILNVNGKDATEGPVVIERDLRGEVPIKVKVSGLDDSPYKPFLRYKGELFSPGIIDYDTDENLLKLDHLPRIESGETENLDLVRPVNDNVHVYDSTRIKFKQKGGKTKENKDKDKGGGILKTITGFFGGNDEESNKNKDQGGILDGITNFLGF